MTTSPEALREAVDRLTVTAQNDKLVMSPDLRLVLSALQKAREALGPFHAAWLRHDPSKPYSTAPYLFTTNDTFRRAAEVYRALSPGGTDE